MKKTTRKKEMAIPGTHDMIMRVVTKEVVPSADIRVLDVGAGEGALSLKLRDVGYEVSACDLFPEMLDVPGVECRGVDANDILPYSDQSFDLVLAVELVEHIENHGTFFTEVARILKSNGKFIFTTPNILSLKSRVSFLFSGYFYSFGTLNPKESNPIKQHISSFTLDQYIWLLSQSGLEVERLTTDKFQNSSLLWFALAPLIRLNARGKYGQTKSVKLQNSTTALLGRKLVIVCTKKSIQ